MQPSAKSTDEKICVYLLLKKLVEGEGGKEAVLTAARRRVKAEHNAALRSSASTSDRAAVWQAVHRKQLQNQFRREMSTVSQAIAHVGEGGQQRPMNHLNNALNNAAGVSTRLHATLRSTGCTYLLSRGVGNYSHNAAAAAAESQSQPGDRTIAYCNVINTDSKAVSTYVEYCVEKYLAKSMTMEAEETQRKKMLTNLNQSHSEALIEMMFSPSVMYLIACHVAKRVLQHCGQMEYHALREFSPSTTLICMHQMSPTDFGIYSQTLPHDEADRFMTAIPLDQAKRVILKSACTATRDQLHHSLMKFSVSLTEQLVLN